MVIAELGIAWLDAFISRARRELVTTCRSCGCRMRAAGHGLRTMAHAHRTLHAGGAHVVEGEERHVPELGRFAEQVRQRQHVAEYAADRALEPLRQTCVRDAAHGRRHRRGCAERPAHGRDERSQ
eukprot:7389322-Prymnesium_polylepis.1